MFNEQLFRRKEIKINIDKLNEWKSIEELIPDYYRLNKKMKKTGIAGIFAASLELSKEGIINIMQKKIFNKILIKKQLK